MVCGACGSEISAEEKYKPLKDGTTKRYIYYGCGRSRDHSCKGNKYVREEELVEKIAELIDQIDVNQFGIRMKFQEELRRFNKFQRSVLGGVGTHNKDTEVDVKTYAKYILREGTNEEKRELMGCFRSKIKITKGVVEIGGSV
jgi:hypothetical protein